MEAALPTTTITFAQSGQLEHLKHSPKLTEQQRVAEAGRQFEAVLVRQMLNETMKPVFAGALDGNLSGQSIYRQMITDSLADAITQQSSFGFQNALVQQVQGAQPVSNHAQRES